MSLVQINMNLTDSKDTFNSYALLGNNKGDARTNIDSFINYLKRMAHGDSVGTLSFYTGAIQAQATLTSTGAATAAQAFILNGVTFTARASGATGNEFNVSAVVATQASAMAASINSSTDVNIYFIASSVAGVCTIKAINPGIFGNIYTLTENLDNVSLSNFATQATGSNGTVYTVDLS